MAKRPREALEESATPASTPKKLRFSNAPTPTKPPQIPSQTTPSKRGRKPKETTNGLSSAQSTPRSARGKAKAVLKTPTKQPQDQIAGGTVTVNANADRSARKKANRALIQRTIEGNTSDNEEDTNLAEQILGEEDGQSSSDSDMEEDGLSIKAANGLPETPSKRGRGRPKGSKNRRTPTPPPNLPPHERYFFHTRTSAAKSSSNTVASQTLLSHAAYHDLISSYEDPHAPDIADLHELHALSYPTWAFQLSQNYTVCLYGYGSKRQVLTSFAEYLHNKSPSRPPKTIIVNGNHPTLSIRNVLLTILRALGLSATGISNTPSTLLSAIIAHQNSQGVSATPVYLLISPLHARPLTSAPTLSILCSLASQSSIRLVLTGSNPSFPILWSSTIRDSLKILFYDATTFLSYDDPSSSVSELGTGVVDSVAELMGKKGPATASRERVNWVLKSLPENARGLYRILVSEILAAEIDGIGAGDNDMNSDDDMGGMGDRSRGDMELPGIDSKVLYQKAVEEFLCSSEMAFRGLLREFLDHAMVVVRKESGSVGGGEVLGIDMGREELEGVLEDIVM